MTQQIVCVCVCTTRCTLTGWNTSQPYTNLLRLSLCLRAILSLAFSPMTSLLFHLQVSLSIYLSFTLPFSLSLSLSISISLLLSLSFFLSLLSLYLLISLLPICLSFFPFSFSLLSPPSLSLYVMSFLSVRVFLSLLYSPPPPLRPTIH